MPIRVVRHWNQQTNRLGLSISPLANVTLTERHAHGVVWDAALYTIRGNRDQHGPIMQYSPSDINTYGRRVNQRSRFLTQFDGLHIGGHLHRPFISRSRIAKLRSLRTEQLRIITGAIGQTNRRGYTISTQGATIGMRGTDHEPSYYPPGDAELAGQPPGTYDKVNDGETVIRNPRGEIAVRPGRSAFVHHDARAAPQLLAREPAFYQRHAGIDRRAAPRRTEIHQRVERERPLRQKPSDAKSEKKTQQDRPKGPEKQQADKKGAKDQPKTGGAQAKTAQERQKTLEKQQADKKGAKDQAKTGGAQAKAAQERQKMLEKQQADKKGAKPEPKSQPKTPQELRQERLKEKEKQQAGKKDAKPQPKAQPKTPQELQKERLKEQEKQRADKTGAKPQPKAGARPKTPEELREERLKELERRRTQ